MSGTPKGSLKVVLWRRRSRESNLRPLVTRYFFVAFLGIKQFSRVGLDLCWFYVGNTQRLTESGFMEKPGIKPAAPGLQGIGLSPTPRWHLLFVAVFLGCTSTGFMFFVVLCPGTPEGSNGSGSGFKASQKMGQRLRVSSDRLGKVRNRTCDPWFTRHRFIPYTTAASSKPFCGFPGYKPVPPGWFKICVLVLFREHPRAHRKWFYGEAGNRTCDPWFTRHRFIPYTTAASSTFCGFPGYKPVPPSWFKICVGFITGTPKGSPKVVFMEKLGIQPATPGLQGIALTHYTTAASSKNFLWLFHG